MILADKITIERKKNGWSQEELAEKLDVSRQSVSKWESAQSVPDMQRILEMSRLFGVSTDYLLKDEIEEETKSGDIVSDREPPLRRVSMEEAQEFLSVKHSVAPKMAIGVFLCLFGAAVLVAMCGIGSCGLFGLNENSGAAIGVSFLLVCVAAAVADFLVCGQKIEKYEYLENEAFDAEYGVEGMANERRKAYREKYGAYVAIGVILCIISAVPLILSACFEASELVKLLMVSVLLVLVGIAVMLILIYAINTESIEILLQEKDHTKEKKSKRSVSGTVSGIYWMLATAVYLAWSFIGNSWDRTWIIWPVAGVLFPVVLTVSEMLFGDKK